MTLQGVGPIPALRRDGAQLSRGGTMVGMGLNPFRVQRRRTSDYVLVAATLVVIVALVAWALL
jgi:hypothetical protein